MSKGRDIYISEADKLHQDYSSIDALVGAYVKTQNDLIKAAETLGKSKSSKGLTNASKLELVSSDYAAFRSSAQEYTLVIRQLKDEKDGKLTLLATLQTQFEAFDLKLKNDKKSKDAVKSARNLLGNFDKALADSKDILTSFDAATDKGLLLIKKIVPETALYLEQLKNVANLDKTKLQAQKVQEETSEASSSKKHKSKSVKVKG